MHVSREIGSLRIVSVYPFKKTVFNCRQATLLSIKRAEGKITFFERVKLRYHLLYCDPCRRFIKQTSKLDHLGKELGQLIADQPPFSLSQDRKAQIQQVLDQLSKG